MMHYSRRLQLTCRFLAAIFLVLGTAQLAIAISTVVNPLYGTATLACDPCTVQVDPVRLLAPEEARIRAWRSPGSEARILDHIQNGSVRTQLFLSEIIRALPFFALFATLALAVHGFGSKGFNRGSVRWLRRSALAGMLWVLTEPIAGSIRMTAMSEISVGAKVFHVALGGRAFLMAVIIACAVWVCLRVMEEALNLRTDLEDYV